MKRAIVLFVSLLLSATSVRAGWSVAGSSVSLNPAGTYCDFDSANNYLWCLNHYGTSTSTALLKIDLTTDTATVVAGPNATSGLSYRSLGISGGVLRVMNSSDRISMASCTLPACSSWTSVIDYSAGTNPTSAGTVESFGSWDYTFVEGRNYGSGNLALSYCTSPVSCTSKTGFSSWRVVAGSSCRVNSDLLISWGWDAGGTPYALYAGMTAAAAEAFADSAQNTNQGTSNVPTQRECVSDGASAYNIYYQGGPGTTWVARAWDGGSSLGHNYITLSGDYRPGAVYAFDATTRVVVWKTTGEAVERTASSTADLSVANITLDSGYTVRGVWYESGMDAPRAIVSNGTLTKVLKWSASSTPPSRAAISRIPNYPLRHLLP